MNHVPRNTRYAIRNTRYAILANLLPSSTSVENPLQISSFYAKQTQFPKSQMNVNPYNTTDYENIANWTLGENKPNSNPIKPNFRKAKMNINSLITKDYRKKDAFAVQKNKAKTNPILPVPKGKDGQKPKEIDEDDENPEETDEDDENPGKGKGGKKN